MNAKKAKAYAYIALSFPVLLVNRWVGLTALFTAGILLDNIAAPLAASRKRIMLDGIRIMGEALNEEQ